MATAAKSDTISQSSGDGSFTGDQSKDSTAVRIVSSPWTQMVRGSESEPFCPLSSDSSPSMADVTGSTSSSVLSGVEALPERSDIRGGGNKADKKPAWNKPLPSGAVEDGPVMDAVSWPALSESTKTLSKSGSSDSLKAVSDGFVPKFQVTGTTSSPLQKQIVTDNAIAISRPVTDNDSFVQPQQGLVVEVSPNAGKLGSSPVVEASFSKESIQKESGQRVGIGSQSHNEQQQQQQHRGSFRRGGGGLNHHRGDGGSYHHNHGGRRDHERGHRDWNRNRSFNGRDSRGYVRAPPPPPHDAPFIPPLQGPLRPPYGNPMVYQAPVVYPMAPPLMFFPAPDPMLHSKILNQIDYYFSPDNLVKDTFLRQNMDELGWVPINLIANFKKVRILTENINYSIQLILGVLRSSSVVEVQGDKVRKRNDWWKWTMQQASVQLPAGGFSHDNMQNYRPEEKKMTEAMAELMDVRTSVLNRGF